MTLQRLALGFASPTAGPSALQMQETSTNEVHIQMFYDARSCVVDTSWVDRPRHTDTATWRTGTAAKNALMVTRLAWIAHRLQSSSRWTMKSSVDCTKYRATSASCCRDYAACSGGHGGPLPQRCNRLRRRSEHTHLLQREQALCCPAKGLRSEHVGDLSHQPREGHFPDEQVRGALVLPDLSQRDCARPVPVRLLHTACQQTTSALLRLRHGLLPNSVAQS